MANSDCTNILNLIPLYIDNMLSDEDTDIVCEHIANCASCRSEYEFLKSIMASAGSLPEIEASKNFHNSLMEKVRAEKRAGTAHKHKLFHWRAVTGIAAAAAVIAVSIVSYINLEGNENSVNPDEFISPAYPSAEPGKPNSEQNKNVVLSESDTEDNVLNEHTQPQNPNVDYNHNNDTGGVNKRAAASKPSAELPAANNKEKPQSRQTEKEPVDTSIQDTTISEPFVQTEASPKKQTVKTESEPELASGDAEAAESGSIAAFKSDDTMDSSSNYPPANDSLQDIKTGGGASGGSTPSKAESSVQRAVRYRVIHVSVAEEEHSKAERILSGFAKDEIGYRVEQDADNVLNKLSNLKGYSTSADVNVEIDSDYIVLKD